MEDSWRHWFWFTMFCLMLLEFLFFLGRWFQYRVRGRQNSMSQMGPQKADSSIILLGGTILFCSSPFFQKNWLTLLLMLGGGYFWYTGARGTGQLTGGIRKGVLKFAFWGAVVGITLGVFAGAMTGSVEGVLVLGILGILFCGLIGFILGAFLVPEEVSPPDPPASA